MTVYGYIRKNFPSKTSTQINSLIRLECNDYYIEDNFLECDIELKKLLKVLQPGDKLILISILSFGKGINEIKKIMGVFHEKKIQLICLEENINSKNTYNLFEILDMMVSIDKKIRGEKIKQILKEKKETGQKLGRPTIDEDTVMLIKKIYKEQKCSLRKIADYCGVSIGTVHKYVK